MGSGLVSGDGASARGGSNVRQRGGGRGGGQVKGGGEGAGGDSPCDGSGRAAGPSSGDSPSRRDTLFIVESGYQSICIGSAKLCCIDFHGEPSGIASRLEMVNNYSGMKRHDVRPEKNPIAATRHLGPTTWGITCRVTG